MVLTAGSDRTAAQAYSIDWFTVDGGGGTSSGGDFKVGGTIGQPDAGVSSGGGITVISGFWGIVQVVQTPGAPQLRATRDATSGVVTVSWPLPDDGWVLDQSPTLGQAPDPWTLVPVGTYQSNATHRFITIPSPSGSNFYRLRKP